MKKRALWLAGLCASVLVYGQSGKQFVFPARSFNIVSFGARNSDFDLNTIAIQKSIDACNRAGGGTVLVPPGYWLTGPLVLKSRVNLHIARGGLLQFTRDRSQYRLVRGNWEGVEQMRNQSPLSAQHAEHIAITGEGIIDGGGDAWRMVKKEKLNETQWQELVRSGGILSEDKKTWYPSASSKRGSAVSGPGLPGEGRDSAFYAGVKDFLRPNLLVLELCSDVLLQGVTFQNSPAWCLHPLMCKNLRVSGIHALNPFYAQNGDGIDVESCDGVTIENSVFDVGDDGICIKSGRDEAGRLRGIPTQHVLVTGCTVYHAHGGFVIGSEMSGGVHDVTVRDCIFIGTDVGLRFKTARGRGGIVERITASDIRMKDIRGEAILFDMYYMAKDPVAAAGETRSSPAREKIAAGPGTPYFRNFDISRIMCDGAQQAVFIRGLPESRVDGISLQDISIRASKGLDTVDVGVLRMKHVRLSDPGGKTVLLVP